MNERSFSERLKAFRKQKGLTQQQLADLLNISNKSVSRWESEGGYPDIELLAPLAKTLGVTVDELLNDTPVQRLSAFDWQNMLSFGFAVGGGVLFFLLDLFTPTLLCYAIYLGALGYGVHLQARYTYRSDWFYRFHLLTNFFVNFSLLARIPWFAAAILTFTADTFFGALDYSYQMNIGLSPYQIDYFGDQGLLVLLCFALTLTLTALTHNLLCKKLDPTAPDGIFAILRDLFPAGFRAAVKNAMPEINEGYDFRNGESSAENRDTAPTSEENPPRED